MTFELYHGNCIDEMRGFPDESVDSVCTDGPYELSFMNHKWDGTGIVNDPNLWREVFRVMKPGAHLLSFGAPRTYHRMACGVEDADFEIRDSIHWFYGTGFPKSLTVGEGQGTALKPAHEPIVLARKPLKGTVAQNIAVYGTGALNIDASRIGVGLEVPGGGNGKANHGGQFGGSGGTNGERPKVKAHTDGRWPANVLFDEDAAFELDAQTADLKVGGSLKGGEGRERSVVSPLSLGPRGVWVPYGDSGGASRFFYVAKPGRRERDFGCEELPAMTAGEVVNRIEGSAGMNSPRAGAGRTSGARNFHPTVKPVELMRYLIKLITPNGGLVLDPFVGSGTTGMAALLEGFDFVGIDQDEKYLTIAHARITAVE